MKKKVERMGLYVIVGAFLMVCNAQDKASSKTQQVSSGNTVKKTDSVSKASVKTQASQCQLESGSKTTLKAADTTSKPQSAAAGKTSSGSKSAPAGAIDTLIVEARLVEIPGTFAPNDLYNYVYIMKYRVMKVLKGSYSKQEILVGQYNPLIPRSQVKDKMDKFVDGDADKFEEGVKHRLTLIKPIEKVWTDAVEDEYFDSDLEKYYALRTDVIK